MSLSYTESENTVLQCDNCGKTVSLHGKKTRISVNRLARKSQWKVGKSGDTCPCCKQRIAALAALIAICLSMILTGCHHSSPDPLPTDIQDQVGDIIIKEPDVLPSSGPLPSGGALPNSNPMISTEVRSIEIGQVKEWLTDIVDGPYTPSSELGFDIETVKLKNGGNAKINSSAGVYISTDFHIRVGDTSAESAATAFVTAYIGREMTDVESEELSKAIAFANTTKDGTDMELTQLEAFGITAVVYALTQNGEIIIQCY